MKYLFGCLCCSLWSVFSLAGDAWQTSIELPEIEGLKDLAVHEENIVVVGDEGRVLYKNGTASWQLASNDASNHLGAVSWNRNQFVAVGSDGHLTASFDGGISWHTQWTGNGANLTGLTTLSHIVAVGEDAIFTNAIPLFWTAVGGGGYTCVTWFKRDYIAVGPNQIAESGSARVWLSRETEMDGPRDITHNGNRLVVVGDHGRIWYSDDKIHWQLAMEADGVDLRAVDWNGMVFRAVGDAVYESADGSQWHAVDAPGIVHHWEQTVAGDEFVALAENTLGQMVVVRGAPAALDSVLLMPWVSNSNEFSSTVIVNNPGDSGANLTLTATRANGESQTVSRSIGPKGILEASASELFPDLGTGAGYSVLISSSLAPLQGSWVTGIAGSDGASPSQGNGILLQECSDFRGTQLMFGYLPAMSGLLAVPVLVNAGPEEIDYNITIYSHTGEQVFTKAFTALEPFKPLPIILSDFVADQSETWQMKVTGPPDSNLTGTLFLFDSAGQTAIANAVAFE